MDRKGFAPVLIIGIIALVVIAAAVGWYLVVRQNATVPAGVACTTEAKQCPDGSYVGRTGPDCQFAACPGVAPQASSTVTTQTSSSSISENISSTWQILSDPSNLFTIQAPSNWDLQVLESDTSTYATKEDTVVFPNGAILFFIDVLTPSQWQAILNSGGNNYLAGSSSQYYFVMTQTDDVEDTTNVSATQILAHMLGVFSTFHVTSSNSQNATWTLESFDGIFNINVPPELQVVEVATSSYVTHVFTVRFNQPGDVDSWNVGTIDVYTQAQWNVIQQLQTDAALPTMFMQGGGFVFAKEYSQSNIDPNFDPMLATLQINNSQ
jgi:hypothetical protein